MERKALLGRWMLIVVGVVVAASELALLGYSLHLGRFRPVQLARMFVGAWLFWRVWEGSSWARWLMAGLFLAAAALSVVVSFDQEMLGGRPELLALLIGFGVGYFLLGVGLASPWVGAFQASRRDTPGG